MTTFTHFDHIFDPVIVFNDKREIIYFNHQATIFFKLPPRLFRQKKELKELCDSDDFDITSWLSAAFVPAEVQLSPEIRLRISQDPERNYFIILKLIPLTDGQTTNFAVLFQDKTVERGLHLKYREQLEELKKTHHQILQADKLTTLGELTANISHEINNPLTIATGHCEIIRDLLNSPNSQSRLPQLINATETVFDSLERVNQIIRNMKDFLHRNEEQKEYCNLSKLIDAAIEWVQPTASKLRIEIEKDYRVNSVALVNRIKIEQVIINLIKNSIDALSEADITGGTVRITLTKSETDQQSCIEVVDNGPGIPAAIRNNLFKPFQTTKEATHGTGLGLSICSKIIESHLGKIELQETAKGCSFLIKLPSIEVYSYTRNDKSLSTNQKQKRILVVDNEVQILNVLHTFFTAEGLVFIGSSDPLDALHFLQKANVDLILTDIDMPGLTGSEFAAKARDAGYTGPILYMTGSRHIDQFNKDKRNLDISGLIVKPFHRDDVMKTILTSLRTKGAA